jgi:hypothetical protein
MTDNQACRLAKRALSSVAGLDHVHLLGTNRSHSSTSTVKSSVSTSHMFQNLCLGFCSNAQNLQRLQLYFAATTPHSRRCRVVMYAALDLRSVLNAATSDSNNMSVTLIFCSAIALNCYSHPTQLRR